jgi:hypothetical protein
MSYNCEIWYYQLTGMGNVNFPNYLIAISSFGECLRRTHRPGGGLFNLRSNQAWGNTAVNVVPMPGLESTQIRPPWFSTTERTIESPSPVPGISPPILLAR